jgi:L-fuconolactonase
MRIDSHQHFWKYSAEDYGWMSSPSLADLRKDRLPEDLKPLLDQHQLDGCIAVQARQRLAETDWLLSLAASNAFIKGVVGWVDLRSPDVTGQLEKYRSNKKLVGVRHVVQDEPDDQFMLGRDFQRGIAALADFDLAYDILIYPNQLPAALSLVEAFPNQRFVIDHIAKPRIKTKEIDTWADYTRRLASHSNVWCKVSGMVTEADWTNWVPNDFEPYLKHIFSVFSIEKLMYGSDWPVSTLAADYGKAFNLVNNLLRSRTARDQTLFFGQNAVQLYRLDQTP